MGRQRKKARVLGPYEEVLPSGRRRWRVKQIDEAGETTTHFADTARKAIKLVRACRIDLGVPCHVEVTVEDVIGMFFEVKMGAGRWDVRTFERARGDLRQFAGDVPHAPMALVNPMWIRSYLDRISYLALATQRSRWHLTSEFLKWSVRRKHLKSNPMDDIENTELPWLGKRARRKMGRGKAQLRNVDEVRAYLEAAGLLPSPARRVAAQLPLLTGMRSGEVRHLRVGDVDFSAGRLWIRDIDDDGDDDGWEVKSASSRRTVGIPNALLEDLRMLCDGQKPDVIMLKSNRGGTDAYERKWLNRMVKRVCGAAGTKVVCVHGLRDTFTSLMAELGQRSVADIGRMVGHADGGRTAQRHYIGVPQHQSPLPQLPRREEV